MDRCSTCLTPPTQVVAITEMVTVLYPSVPKITHTHTHITLKASIIMTLLHSMITMSIRQDRRLFSTRKSLTSTHVFIKAGLPMILFAVGATFVLQSAIEGKNKEREVSRGQLSKSERQAKMETEHADMMQKIQTVRTTDFDNTKRIERPEEVLERRRQERAKKNIWYRRWSRYLTGQKE